MDRVAAVNGEQQQMADLSVMEKLVFGSDAERHPITGMVLERGSGALPIEAQARGHLALIAATQGQAAADAMRIRLDAAERKSEILKGEAKGHD
jgi:hypothetical protein